MTVLREELLAGRAIALAGRGRAAGIRDRLMELGGEVSELALPAAFDDQQALDWVRARAPVGAVVHDGRGGFGDGGHAALTAVLEDAWRAIAAVANGALIPSGEGGRVVLIAPPARAGEYADAARSALENLARTLSIEWARYAITTTAIWPGHDSAEDDLAELVAFLLSHAGDYYSGCLFELGAV